MADIHCIYERLPANERFLVKTRGANHFLFSDDCPLLNSHLLMGARRKFGIVRTDGPRQLAVTSNCLCSFYDAYVKGTHVPKINISSSVHPELQVLD